MGKTTDKNLFRDFIGEVEPLEQDRIPPYRAPLSPIARQSLADERQVMDSLLSWEQEDIPVESGETLSFARPGLQHTVLKKLRKGHYVVEAMLDLHGKTVPEAAEALSVFIQSAQRDGCRCVRIIHGKGQRSPDKIPVLKTKVNSWLQRKQEVLAFCSARQVDGGTGAVYVLLRKK